MILCPARLDPTFSPRPWGSLSLAPFFPEQTSLAEPIGEAWLTGSECRFANGPFAGQKLGESWPKMPPAWAGTLASMDRDFPLLVKFIFSDDKLSVQVHPDDEYASRHEQGAGGRGKTEMWYAVRTSPGAEVLVGLKPSVTLENFRKAIEDGNAEDCLEHIPVHSGEAILPAGIAHTIGPGIIFCEIQQQSDLTYRVYDYGRRDAKGQQRPLHIEKALEVIRFGEQKGGKIEPLRVACGPVTETYFAACKYFATEKWEFAELTRASTAREHFDLLIFLEGTGDISWGSERAEYKPAQVWMIPAALDDYELTPGARTTLLRTYVPSGTDEFVQRLSERGVDKTASAHLVYS